MFGCLPTPGHGGPQPPEPLGFYGGADPREPCVRSSPFAPLARVRASIGISCGVSPAGRALSRRPHEDPRPLLLPRGRPRRRRFAPRRRRGHVDAAADPRPRPEAEGDGIRGRPCGVRRPHRPAHGRDRVARRLHGVLRLARGPDRHQPPLRAGVAPVQLDPAEEPAGGRLPREDPRGGALERSRLPRLRHRLRQGGDGRDHRQDRREARRPQALRPRRAARQGAGGGLRGGWASLLGERLLRRPEVLRDRAARDPGRAPRLRPGRRHRQLRRRDGQLALAAAHRRLVLLPRLRGEGRQAGELLEGQRALRAGALPARPGRRRRRKGTSSSWSATPAARSATRPTPR